MQEKETKRSAKRQLIPLLIYTLLLCGIYGVYTLGARYELFMQTLDTLWPVIVFTLLLVLAIANSLMLARGIPLWLLCTLHVVLMGLYLASQWLGIRRHSHEHGDGHICGFPWWLPLIPLVLSTLPALLGHVLLQVRRRQVEKEQEADAELFSLQNPSDILGDANTETEDDSGENADQRDK